MLNRDEISPEGTAQSNQVLRKPVQGHLKISVLAQALDECVIILGIQLIT